MVEANEVAPREESPAINAVTRRELLAGAVGAVGGAMLAGLPRVASAQQPAAPALPPLLKPPDDPTKVIGAPTSTVGARSQFVQPTRRPPGAITGSSLTPLQDLSGTITPADLHFERHHAGVPLIDPSRHSLLVHGLVERPMMFSLDDIKRFPQVTRIYFLECAGNGGAAFGAPRPTYTPQGVAGLTSNSEWTGVPLALLFQEAGAKREAEWFLAEGGDAAVLTRSIPMTKAREDALVVWAQNGEPLRPEQGFPMRLLLPGWEGSANVKWLRRLELGLHPWMTRWETSVYTDPLRNGTARQFSFEMDAKSIITSPSHPMTITRGWRPVSGLAWSGRGKIARVEVSTDAGKSWQEAKLQEPVLSKAHVRFTHMWDWDGRDTILLSRATDETGYVQPTRAELIRVRGPGTGYHWNAIYGWKVQSDGQVFFHGET